MNKILSPIQTTWLDYPDNNSLAVIVCMMGCDNNCPFCQNIQLKDPNYNEGTETVTVDELISKLTILCQRNKTNKVVLSGGDPLSCYNIKFTKEFLAKSSFDVCIYTGHNKEYCQNNDVKGFKFLKCGYYDNNHKRESCKTDNYIQFSSPNQELYDENYCLLTKNGIYYF